MKISPYLCIRNKQKEERMKENITPIPVMFSHNGEKGPWQLGYIHPDDLEKITPADQNSAIVNIWERDVDVYQMSDGIPDIPKWIVPLDKFKVPDWRPSWNWCTYCEHRKNSK